jgi:alkylation response protein AidB-like acyl-CoA dehydrogenase
MTDDPIAFEAVGNCKNKCQWGRDQSNKRKSPFDRTNLTEASFFMDFEFSPEERRFIEEVREFLREQAMLPDAADVMAPDRDSDSMLSDTPARRRFNREMAQRGYLGMSWPKQYGGSEKSGIYEYLLNEELARVGAPLIGKGIGIIGKTLIRHGSEKLKSEFLPKIRSAEIEFALGYSEPGAGSDLASLKLRAERSGEGWSFNGQKTWNTSAHFADWYWLAARTDPAAPKHKGISLFLVPMNDPGITVRAIHTLGEHRTNHVFLDNVWVHDDYRVGELNKGWTYISEALDLERFSIYPISPLEVKLERMWQYVKTAKRDGRALTSIPEVRRQMARIVAQVETAKMLQRRAIFSASQGGVPTAEASMFKLYTTTLSQRMANTMMDILGPHGLLHKSCADAPAAGKWEWNYRSSALETIGAGTSEIQKNIIARRGLGLPLTN